MRKLAIFFITLTQALHSSAQKADLTDYLRVKQYEKVIELIPTLSVADSADINTTSAVAQAFEGMLDYRQAYSWYKMNKPNEERTDYFLSMGKVSLSLGRNKEATDYFSSVLRIDSTNFYARYQLAQIARASDDMEKAIDLFERLSFAYPDNISLHTILADCYLKVKDGARAAYALLAAHKLNRENPDIAANLSNLILQIGAKPKDAIVICDTTLRYAPDDRKLLSAKAMALYTNKDYEEADSVFRKLFILRDSSFINLKYAGASRLGIQSYKPADTVLSLAWQTNPDEVENALLYARALTGCRLPDEALKILKHCDSLLVPQKAYVYEILKTRADCARQQKKYEESLKYYYDAYQLLPDRKAILMAMASLCRELPRDKSLFILKEIADTARNQKQSLKPFGKLYSILLKEYQNDLFFENAKTVNIKSPDGKISQISFEEIEIMIDAFK